MTTTYLLQKPYNSSQTSSSSFEYYFMIINIISKGKSCFYIHSLSFSSFFISPTLNIICVHTKHYFLYFYYMGSKINMAVLFRGIRQLSYRYVPWVWWFDYHGGALSIRYFTLLLKENETMYELVPKKFLSPSLIYVLLLPLLSLTVAPFSAVVYLWTSFCEHIVFAQQAEAF